MSQTIPNAKLDRSHIAPVKTREELIYLLSRAAELEHGLACIYLFAAYSLKSDVSEGGMTDEQATMVRDWRRSLQWCIRHHAAHAVALLCSYRGN